MGLKQQVVAVLQGYKGVVRLAKLAGAFDNCIEHWFDICRRGGDHTKDIAASGLMGQRLREVARLRLHLVEQADIADGDHGLVGEGLQQSDLLVGERVYFEAAK